MRHPADTVIIGVRVAPRDKAAAEAVIAEHGHDLHDVIRHLLAALVHTRSIPFPIQIPTDDDVVRQLAATDDGAKPTQVLGTRVDRRLRQTAAAILHACGWDLALVVRTLLFAIARTGTIPPGVIPRTDEIVDNEVRRLSDLSAAAT